MAHLDDRNGLPAQPKFLDLSSLKPQTKEEVQNALYKIPEMKLRPEKILEDEDVLVPQSWRCLKEYPYLNPVPSSMQHVNIQELSKVDIDWKMLTLNRPDTALEIQIFSRNNAYNPLKVVFHSFKIKCLMGKVDAYYSPYRNNPLVPEPAFFHYYEERFEMFFFNKKETKTVERIIKRIVYLSKVTLKCIAKEKAKKEKAQSIRLRMLGRFKIAKESDNIKIEELTYEFFSRNFGANDRGQAMEDIPKPPTADASKVPPSAVKDTNEVVTVKDETIPKAPRSKKRKTNLKRKKVSKKKKGKKNKLRKHKIAGKLAGKNASKLSALSSKSTIQKWKGKRNTNSGKHCKKKHDSSSKTLVQMLKAKEKAEKKQRKGNS